MRLISNKIVGMVQVLDEMGHGLSEDWEREDICFISGCLEAAYIYG